VTVVPDIEPSRAPAKRRVLVVDDHRIFAELLVSALTREPDFACVGIASTAASAVDLALRETPDLVVMDIRLGQDSGLAVARRIREVLPDVVVVVVSQHHGTQWVSRALEAGASAFAAKSGSFDEMLSVLRNAAIGSMMVSPSTFEEPPPSEQPVFEGIQPLSAREREILGLMAEALAPQDIAPRLHISVNTCRGYVNSIRAKLGVRTQLEAVIKAQRLGLIGPPLQR
jgi:DNA-binding NarL/FixJ family response regulator